MNRYLDILVETKGEKEKRRKKRKKERENKKLRNVDPD
tara:strand:+ start:521 stop:634 length:114 start_codon:yes stop_codon:yes gene_type:complete